MSSPESESTSVVGGCEEPFKSRFPMSSQSSPSSQSFLPCLLPSQPTVGTGVTSLLSSLTKPPQASPPVPLDVISLCRDSSASWSWWGSYIFVQDWIIST